MTQFAKNSLILMSILALAAVSACDKSDSRSDEEQAEASAAKAQPQEEAAGEEASATDEEQAPTEVAQPGQSPTSLDELPEGVNAVQNEMQLLNTAMQTTLTLIANNQLDGIPAQIKKVHPAKQLTHKAIEKGVYAPPKNGDKIDEFVEMDEAFHDDLKGLLKASKQDDLQMATDKFGDLVQGCTSCHTKFRY